MVRVALAALLVAQASAAAPLCEARARVEPSDAYVGQQLLYRLQILRDAEGVEVRFAEDLAFPSFRAEWLPAETLDAAARDPGFVAGGIVVEERRALFAVRAGHLAIPAARIECRTAEGSAFAEVASGSVAVSEPPAAGRADGGGPLVGRVAIRAHLSRERIALGESVVLTVSLRGEADLWDAAPPLAADSIAGLDVHARPPEIERNAGSHLMLERSFVYDLVPRRDGRYEIPALRVVWLDPATGRYEAAASAALGLEVMEPAASGPPASADLGSGKAASGGPQRRRPFAPWVLAVGLALGVAAVLAWRRAGARSSPARAAAAHLAAAASAAARGDRAAERSALAAALRAALAARWPAASALAAEELVAQSDGARRDAAELFAALDRGRFAAAPALPPPPADRVRALIRAL